MRIHIFASILLVTSAFLSSKAQPRTYIGVTGAGQLSSSYIEHNLYIINLSTTYLTTFQGGLWLKRYNEYNSNFKMNSGWQTGLVYSRKGWKQTFQGIYPGINTTMDYLVLPVDALVYWGNENYKISLIIGMYGEYLVNSSSPEAPDPDSIFNNVFYTYDPDRDKQFGYGLKLGGSFLRAFGTSLIEISGYFDYSLSNFIETEVRSSPVPDISNLFNFGISIGYFIPIGKK